MTLLRCAGVRDFVEFKSSGYNQPRRPGRQGGGKDLNLSILSEESEGETESPILKGVGVVVSCTILRLYDQAYTSEHTCSVISAYMQFQFSGE